MRLWHTVGGKGADFWNQQKYFFKKKLYENWLLFEFCLQSIPTQSVVFLFMKLHKSGTFGKEDRYGSGYITFGEKARSPNVKL
ncbi:hypothetical protein DOZ91_25810 [Peribacillus frigoritolerans]|nr:hypothetical protein DOZ91_25810 [Peribacillus frigoritolerans]